MNHPTPTAHKDGEAELKRQIYALETMAHNDGLTHAQAKRLSSLRRQLARIKGERRP